MAWLPWLAIQSVRQPRFPFRGEEVIEHAQRRRVAAAIRYAYRYVPHYREVMDGAGIGPAEIQTAADLARLPIIERLELQRDPERFVSRAHALEDYARVRTSGSSGVPVAVYHNRSELLRGAAYQQRSAALRRRLARRGLTCRTLRINHRVEPSQRQTDVVLASLGRLVGVQRRLVSILDPVERNVAEINRFRPHIVSSFGSYLEALFVHLDATGQPFHRPALVTYGSDAMSPAVRSLITEKFGIAVLGGYGSYEAFGLGFECPAHRGFHINVDLYPMRLVDRGGREVTRGEPGEVVISNLVNRGTVLFNYHLGDLAAWLPGPCPCGRGLPLLSFIQGRVADWLQTPSGRRLHPETVAAVLDDEPDVLRFQAIQTAPDHVTLRVVVRPSTSDRDALGRRVAHGFERLSGLEINSRVEFVDDLHRTAGGKVRTVVGLASGG